MKKALIVSAEPSADTYALAVLEEFRRRDPVRFHGVGGDRLQDAGVNILIHNRRMGIVGIVEVVFSLLRMKRYMERLVDFARRERVDFALLIDFPDFNLRLARRLHREKIPVYYYISPTIWAWRYRRIRLIRRVVTHMFLIFPFESDIYRREGIPHTYIGHPLHRRVHSTRLGREMLVRQLDAREKTVLAILPGSRHSEIRRHLPTLIRVMKRIQERIPRVLFVLLKADHIEKKMLEDALRGQDLDIRIVLQEQAYDLMAVSRAALSSCGTSNLEICLLGTPFCAFYRVHPLSYLLGKGMLKIDRYSIVNILSGRPVIREFIQSGMREEDLFREALRLLTDSSYRQGMISDFARVSAGLAQEENPAVMITDKILALQDDAENRDRGDIQ